MNELTPQFDATSEWRNRSHERIDNVEKAQLMASAEDGWRDAIKNAGAFAMKATERGDVLGNMASQVNYQAAVSMTTVEGPKAVQAVAEAYDAAHNPQLPTSYNQPPTA